MIYNRIYKLFRTSSHSEYILSFDNGLICGYFDAQDVGTYHFVVNINAQATLGLSNKLAQLFFRKKLYTLLVLSKLLHRIGTKTTVKLYFSRTRINKTSYTFLQGEQKSRDSSNIELAKAKCEEVAKSD